MGSESIGPFGPRPHRLSTNFVLVEFNDLVKNIENKKILAA